MPRLRSKEPATHHFEKPAIAFGEMDFADRSGSISGKNNSRYCNELISEKIGRFTNSEKSAAPENKVAHIFDD